jgi:hypothetical protein
MELEALIAANQIDELTQKISQTQRTIDNLATIRLAAIDAETENIQERLSDTFEDSRNIDRFLKSALTMRDQVVNGGPGAAASNALALNLLKAQIFTTAGTDENLANVTLQTSLLSPTEQEMAADLDSLIGVLQRRQTDLEAEIRAISTQLLASESQEAQSAAGSQDNPLNPYGFNDVANFSIDGTSIDKKILELHEYIREFQGDIARYQGRLLDLSQARNLAWETYKNLVTKEAELGVVTGIQGKALSLASPATAPEGDPVNTLKNVLLSTAVGLTLGVLSAFALEFWWKYKGLDPVPVRIVKFRKTGG